jgi:AraC family transcriptional regulator, exoenzyme S synthesis regulatory protein ExsA
MIKQHQQFGLYNKRIFERVVLTPPARLLASMPNEACFYYAVKGNSRFRTPTQQIALEAEEALVLKCGNYFTEWLESNKDEYCEVIAVHFYPEVLRKIYDKELPDFLTEVGRIEPMLLNKSKADELLTNYVSSLQFYFQNEELVSDELLKLKVKELILLLAKTDNVEMITQLLAGLFSPTRYTLKEIIEANVYSNLSIDELAKLANISTSTFKREFTKIYQQSPGRYIKERKLSRAADLLLKTDRRISDIAFDCGFVEVAHFSRSFQKRYGVSPSNYRLN